MRRTNILTHGLGILALSGLLCGTAAAQGNVDEELPPQPKPPATQSNDGAIAPPPEIEIPSVEEVQGQPAPAGQNGPGTPLRIRAPYTDVDLEPGDPGEVRVRTPWARVRVGGGGVFVDTPIGPIRIGADQLREALPPPERVEPAGPRPAMGIRLRDDDGGVRVSSVVEGSPAAEANLAPGDRIISLGGVRYGDSNSVIRAISRMRVGDQVRVIIERDGHRYGANIKLQPHSDTFAETSKAEQTAEF